MPSDQETSAQIDQLLAELQQSQQQPQAAPSLPEEAPSAEVQKAMGDAEASVFLDSIMAELSGKQAQQQQPAAAEPAAFQGGFRLPSSPQEAQQMAQRAEQQLSQEALVAGMKEGAAGAIRGAGPYAAGAAVGGMLGGPPGAVIGAQTVGLTKMVLDPVTIGVNALFGTNFATPSEGFERIFDALGVSRPKTEAGKIVQDIAAVTADTSSAIRSGVMLFENPGSSPFVKRIGQFLSENPTEQLAAGVGAVLGAEGAGQVAQSFGAEDGGQAVARFVGGLGGSVGASAASRLRVAEKPILNRVPGMTSEQVAAAVEAAKAADRGPKTTDVFRPQGRIQQMIYNVLEAATGGRAQRQVKQNKEAMADLLKEFGYVHGTDYAEPLSLSLLAERESRLSLKKKQLEPIFESLDRSGKAVPVKNTLDFIDGKISELRKRNDITNAPLIDKLRAIRNGLVERPVLVGTPAVPYNVEFAGALPQSLAKVLTPEGKPFQGIGGKILFTESAGDAGVFLVEGKLASQVDEQLKQVGTLLADPALGVIKDAADKTKKLLYSSIKKDIGSFILEEGGKDAYKKWVSANADLAEMARERKVSSFKRSLNLGEINPSVIDNALLHSDKGTFDILVKNLNDQGKAIAKTRLLQHAVEKSFSSETADISTDLFFKNMKAMEPKIKAIFKGRDYDVVDGFLKHIQLTKPSSKIGANPLTGNKLFLPFIGGTLYTALGPEGAAIASASIYTAAHIFESGPVRDGLIKLSRLNIEAPEAGALAKRINQAWQVTGNEFALKQLEERNVQLAFNDKALRKEMIGQGYVLDDSLSGYRIISKDGQKARLLGPTGQLMGIYDSVDAARKRANLDAYKRAKKDIKDQSYAP